MDIDKHPVMGTLLILGLIVTVIFLVRAGHQGTSGTGVNTVCADGWVSHSTGPGTCSHHGGER